MAVLKKLLCLGVGLCLVSGCSLSQPASSPSSSQPEADGDAITVSGIVTAVNGNEVTLDLVTMGGGAPDGAAPESAEGLGGGESTGSLPEGMPQGGNFPESGGFPEGGPGQNEGGSQAASGQDATAAGTQPSPGRMGAMGGQAGANYQRTGETAVYQIPVGAPVTTMAGTVKDFNSLNTDTLVTITLEEREDGTLRPVSVRVIQSV